MFSAGILKKQKVMLTYLLSQSQCDKVKMLVLKTPWSYENEAMVSLQWSCSLQHLSVSSKTPAEDKKAGKDFFYLIVFNLVNIHVQFTCYMCI